MLSVYRGELNCGKMYNCIVCYCTANSLWFKCIYCVMHTHMLTITFTWIRNSVVHPRNFALQLRIMKRVTFRTNAAKMSMSKEDRTDCLHIINFQHDFAELQCFDTVGGFYGLPACKTCFTNLTVTLGRPSITWGNSRKTDKQKPEVSVQFHITTQSSLGLDNFGYLQSVV